ncbi:BlaI/MecI/CopY family transcriptional regulator [Rhodanobacter sp. FW106-PBR-LB-2-11]|uniref:BlaI/MecI/CopY family transcriptional regulator n=1 Tax=Rhodanobacter sp. FW106-PBR-LB-2-11 TaxID=1524463 RepID=UPI0034E499B9
MRKPTIGDQELALLHHIDECGSASVGEVAASFGEPRGLARSTVLTMMERLRGKGYLKRRQLKGMFRYSTATGPGEVMRSDLAREKRIPCRVIQSTQGERHDEDNAGALHARIQARSGAAGRGWPEPGLSGQDAWTG